MAELLSKNCFRASVIVYTRSSHKSPSRDPLVFPVSTHIRHRVDLVMATVPYLILVFYFQIVGVQQYPIRPQTADLNENVLSDQLANESVLTEELIKQAGRRLEDALEEFEAYCSSLHIDPHNSGFR